LGIAGLFLKFQAIKETICEMAGGRERGSTPNWIAV
jgi:hypothetical protein